ncbi:head-tail adaptor protein [Kaistia geumhonensis]|uniref:Head-tail adaptor n=1 Tax=Kaistia geumhonensis TaxID=410839 RepID=A0ABU0M6B2_9HYPH|nr:head-tail adaptor protein [Kaistia geumhonensis]MCX5478454.1 head-tail adaptor protein [Kaistia geumhonensis]MDQ0516328.1 head-tail adaptor [Kaistia geumhonensis]
MGAGDLRERLSFQKRAAIDDGFGNPVSGPFVEQFVVWGRIQYLKGGEGVQAARLAGTQPVILHVRASRQTRTISPDWRAVDARRGTIFNITAAANMDERNVMIEILASSGEASG